MSDTALQHRLLVSLLRDVSRSFYLTLRWLPREIRPQISLAYLFARATDTVADTKIVPRKMRLGILGALREQFTRGATTKSFAHDKNWICVLENQSSTAEQSLLENLDKCFSLLASFDLEDQRLLAELLDVIISGQMFDLETFPGESERELTALATPEDLDRYTYLVAGCVGEFWTRMCAAHLPLPPSWKNDAMEPVAVRFGKGLQLVNVLRDLPRDLRIGRCYLPSAELAATGLRPEDLLEKNAESKLRPIYDRYLGLASAHLDAGWQYTLQIPPSQWRLRLACALPLLIGWKTIKRLRESPAILDPSAAIKVPRREVKLLVARTFLISRSNRALDRCRQTLRP